MADIFDVIEKFLCDFFIGAIAVIGFKIAEYIAHFEFAVANALGDGDDFSDTK